MAPRSDDMLLGELLYQARKRKGVSISEASAATRVSPRVIEAFENDDYAGMPPRGYARNMLGAYSAFLGLDRKRVLSLYEDGFVAAANGHPYRSSSQYRQGRPIDVSTAGWVDPDAGRKKASVPRPSVSRNFDPYGANDARVTGQMSPVGRGQGSGSRPSVARGSQKGQRRSGAGDARRLRHTSSLERPGIDDDASPRAVTGYHRGPNDQQRQMRAADGRQQSGRYSTRQRRTESAGVRNARRARDATRLNELGEQQRREGRRLRQRTQGRQSQQGFSLHGFGLLREREERQRRIHDAPLVSRLKLYLPIIVIAVMVVLAIVLIATANSHRNSQETIQVVSAAQVSSTASSTGRQTGTTTTTTGAGATSYEVNVSQSKTCAVTVTVDGTNAYSGTIVGPSTQSYSASRAIEISLSTTEGVTVTKDGKAVQLTPADGGGATYTEDLTSS